MALVTDSKPDREQQPEEKPEPKTVGNDPSKRWRGGKGCKQRMEERANYAYTIMLEGGTRRQNVQKIMDRFNVSIATAELDYSKGQKALQEEQSKQRGDLLNQIQALRLATIQKALKRGHFQTVATLLKDMGAVIGEAAPEAGAIQQPQLQIMIEQANIAGTDQQQLPASKDMEIVEISEDPDTN